MGARWAVTTWVLSTLAPLLTIMVAVAINAPSYLQRGYRSLLLQLNELTAGVQIGNIA